MFEKLELNGVITYEPKIFEDNRGIFYEGYNKQLFIENGIDCNFLQDNFSKSINKYTIRGLHFQKGEHAQAKLVWCNKGSILDCIVDLRKESKTFLSYLTIKLSEENKERIYIPRGFAHGFITLEHNTEVSYKVDNFYNKSSEETIIYNEENLNINWGINLNKENITVSMKDLKGKDLYELGFLK